MHKLIELPFIGEIKDLYFYLAVGGLILLLLIIIILIASSVAKKKKKTAMKTTVTKPVMEKAPIKEETPPIKKEVVEVEKPVAINAVEPMKSISPAKKEKTATTDKRYVGKFVIFMEAKDLYRYRLQASNGEVIVISEPYTSEKGCRAGIETLKKNIKDDTFDIIEDKHGLFSLRIITKLGRILAQSASYKTKARVENLCDSLARFVTTETIEVEEASKATHFEAEAFKVEIAPEGKGKFVITEDDGFVYLLKASNGRVICKSQSYSSKESCKDAIEKFRAAVYEEPFYISKDKKGKFQFKLYNKQKRLVIAGEIYDDKARAISVIESIKRFAKLAEVIAE